MRPVAQANLEKRVLSLVNEERRKAGLGRLTMDGLLTVAARAHSVDMAARHYFGHLSPEGTSVADRVTVAGYRWSIVGENLAWGQQNALQVVKAWMYSPGHKANILSDRYEHIGIGVADDPKGTLLWTQNFASPE